MTRPLSTLAGALVLIAGLAVSGGHTASADSTGAAGRDNSCQRTQRTINTNDYAGVCCKVTVGARIKYFRTNRKKCLESKGAVVNRSLCPRRSRSTSQDSWVCCETDTTPGLGARIVGKRVSHALTPAAQCRKRDHAKVVARHHCVKKRTRRDRMIACKQRGEGWLWRNGRCVRESLRDRRDP